MCYTSRASLSAISIYLAALAREQRRPHRRQVVLRRCVEVTCGTRRATVRFRYLAGNRHIAAALQEFPAG